MAHENSNVTSFSEQKLENERIASGYCPNLSVIFERNESKEDRLWTFEEALKVIGFGKVQVELLFVVGLILIAVLNETMGISFILPAAQCDLNLSTQDKGFLSSMTFLGIMVASYLWGFLGDTQGRRVVILWTLFFSVASTLISVFVKNFAVFALCRFFTGIFVAGYSATCYAYVGEFNSNKNRAVIISLVSAFIGLSAIYEPITAMWILSYDFKFELYEGYLFRPWRLCLIVYTIPGIIAGFWLLKFPESPKFLLSQNKNDEALKIVRWMLIKNKGKHNQPQIYKLKSEMSESNGKNYKGMKALMMSLVNQTFPLFRPPFVLYFSVCSFLHFGTFAVSGGMAIFLPDILNKLSASENMGLCDIIQMKTPVKNGTAEVDLSEN